jgi:RNA polymerase sigma factor (sigma-70 family)
MNQACEGIEELAVESTEAGTRLECHLLETLFWEYWPKLTSWLYPVVRCRDTAAELTQEAYLRLLSFSRQETIRHPRAFLYQTAKNLALDHLRKDKVQALHVTDFDEAAQVPADQPSAERVLLDRERVDQFLSAMETMPSRSREVFVLHRVEELSYRQIAHRLNISESAVEKNIMRALTHCRRALEDCGAQ